LSGVTGLTLFESSVREEAGVQQLSWTDDMMLRAERAETPMQIPMLLIYDPSTAPGGKVTFKGSLEELDARLHLAPTFSAAAN
jgi:diacylglycerol O-acyltransferase